MRSDRGFLNALAILLIIFVGLAVSSSAFEGDKPSDLEVKAAFIFNFAIFTQWEKTPADPTAIVIGVFSDQPKAMEAFEKVLSGKKVEDRVIKLLRISAPEDADQCHIIFFPRDFSSLETATLKHLSQQCVLTVGEGEEFLTQGGMMGFQLEKQQVRFLANRARAEALGIRLSSKLLRLASKVVE